MDRVAPFFDSQCILWPNGWMHQHATWHRGRPHPRRLCVRWEPTPTRKGAEPQQFSAEVYFCQTAAWIKMPLGTEVRPRPTRHCVRCGPTLPPEKRAHPPSPNFGPCSLWPNGWMDEDAAWYGSRSRRRPHIVLDGVLASEKGAQRPLLFGPCLLWDLWPRLPISATADLLLYFR